MVEDPFATPLGERRPARRLRGRLAAPVTVWTAGSEQEIAGLTISSMLVADGDPPRVVGLVNDMSDLWAALQETGAFVVHVLERRHRVLAERFAGTAPAPGGVFRDLALEPTRWGPRLRDVATTACCRVTTERDVGYARLVEGVVEELALGELDDPLIFFRGRYRGLAPRPGA